MLLMAAACVVHVGNFAFQMIMGRMLAGSPGEFGVLNTMLNIFGFVAIPATAIQLTIARQTAIFADRGDTSSVGALLVRAGRKAMLVGAILFVGLLALSPWLKSFLQLTQYAPLVATAALIACGAVAPVMLGGLQGLKRFDWMSIVNVGMPAVRILVGVGLVWFGWKASGALAGSVAGILFTIVLPLVLLREVLRRREAMRTLDTSSSYRYLGPTLLALVCYAGLVTLDLVVVKHYFTPEQTSDYAAASLFGRAVGWLISPLCTVLFPHVWDESKHEANRALLFRFLLLAAGVGVAAALVCWASAGLLTKLLLGRANAEVTALIPVCAWAMLPIGVANVFLNFVMARGRYGFLVVFAVVALAYVGAFALWHDSVRHILEVVAVFGVITLVLFVVVTYAKPGPRKSDATA